NILVLTALLLGYPSLGLATPDIARVVEDITVLDYNYSTLTAVGLLPDGEEIALFFQNIEQMLKCLGSGKPVGMKCDSDGNCIETLVSVDITLPSLYLPQINGIYTGRQSKCLHFGW
ncbi:hypothetical protein OAO01_09285, partial [Oligoflexia bacterium]|nr:hypothetical protein [Oligoflexia bacterium]